VGRAGVGGSLEEGPAGAGVAWDGNLWTWLWGTSAGHTWLEGAESKMVGLDGLEGKLRGQQRR
jgi:hypothetical protein